MLLLRELGYYLDLEVVYQWTGPHNNKEGGTKPGDIGSVLDLTIKVTGGESFILVNFPGMIFFSFSAYLLCI
jgi:hypothetical protein